MKTRPVRLAPCAAGARPRTSTRAAGSPKPGIGRPQYVSSANAARFSRATCSRHATSRGQRGRRRSRARQADESLGAVELAREPRRGAALTPPAAAATSSPRIRRSMSGCRSVTRSGWPGAQLARDELERRADDRERVVGRGVGRAAAALGGAHGLLVHDLRDRAQRVVAQLGDARPGADGLDEHRLRHRRVRLDALEDRPQARAVARLEVQAAAARRLDERLARTTRDAYRTARGCTPPCWRSARRTSPSTCPASRLIASALASA